MGCILTKQKGEITKATHQLEKVTASNNDCYDNNANIFSSLSCSPSSDPTGSRTLRNHPDLFIDTSQLTGVQPLLSLNLPQSTSNPSFPIITPRVSNRTNSNGSRKAKMNIQSWGNEFTSDNAISCPTNTSTMNQLVDDAWEALEAFRDGWSGCARSTRERDGEGVYAVIFEILSEYSARILTHDSETNQGIRIILDGNKGGKSVKIGDDGVRGLAEMLLRNCNLRHLEIINDEISSLGAEHIGRGLRYNVTLVVLNLSFNPLKDAGVESLLRDFHKGNNALQELYLKDVGMTDKGCMKVATCFLTENIKLQMLDLSQNFISRNGIECLSRTLPAYSRLCQLQILIQDQKNVNENAANEAVLVTAPTRVLGNDIVSAAIRQSEKSLNDSTKLPELGTQEDVECSSSGSSESLQSKTSREGSTDFVHDIELAQRENNLDCRRIRVGFSELCGNRAQMQDIVFVKSAFRGNSGEHLFAVFDGHGGVECARFVRANFANIFEEALNEACVPKAESHVDANSTRAGDDGGGCRAVETEALIEKCLMRAFERINAWCNSYSIPHGTCAVITFVHGTSIYTACVGDSQSIMAYEQGQEEVAVELLSTVVKPSDPEELARIESCGGFVNSRGRVDGVIAVSRALGDVKHQPKITWEPIIKKTQMKDECLIILASDGVWNVYSPENAAKMIFGIDDPSSAAKALCDKAYKAGSNDNISVICIRLCI